MYLNLRCRCYIKLYDSPPKSSTGEDDDMSNLLPSQKKKMRQRQRKAEARAKKVLWFIIVVVVGGFLFVDFLYILFHIRRQMWKMKKQIIPVCQSRGNGMSSLLIQTHTEKSWCRLFSVFVYVCGWAGLWSSVNFISFSYRLKIHYWRLQSTWSYFRSILPIPWTHTYFLLK